MVRACDWATARRRARSRGYDPSLIENAQDVRAVIDGCWFDSAAADRIVEFFVRFLRHSKGQWAGQPFALLDWQAHALRRLFGWKRVDGTRRFRRGGIWVPKKQGKSTMAAGLELYLLVADDEPGAEVYTAAVDRGQAGIIYAEVASMVRQSPDLRKRLQVVDSRKTIAYPGMAAKLVALSADVENREGINAHGVIKDELHAWKNRQMWDVLAYAGSSRRQPMDLSVSTAGVYDETAIGWEQYDYARKVLTDQIQDWAFFALIFEAAVDDDWTDPAIWQKANPSFGVTIDPDTFAQECREAQQSPAKQNAFRRYRLNQWVRQVTRAIDLAVWDEQRGHATPWTPEAFAGRVVYGGLDLSSVSDLSCVVYGAACAEDPAALDVAARFWVPEWQLSNERNPNRELYQQWARQGWLTTTPGNAIDYDAIEDALIADATRFDLRGVNLDRLFQGQSVQNHLVDAGLPVTPMGQGFLSQGPAMKVFHRRLLNRTLHHGGHPILRFCADNTETATDAAGNEKIVKPRGASSKKVDGMVSLVMMLDVESRVVATLAPTYTMVVLGGPR
jgi:phage terminase large subunit-like protein